METFKIEVGILQSKKLEYTYGEDLNRDKMSKLIRHCVNMDSWKHSWHLDVDDPENYPKFLEIVKEKIQTRRQEINELRECERQLLERVF